MNAFFSIDSTPLIAIHGWGMDASSWDVLEPQLQGKLPLKAINLPGYIDSPTLTDMTMDKVVDWLAKQFDGKCHLLGWSMGGLVAQAFSGAYPERVMSLSCVGSTPRFVQTDDWPHALSSEVLDTFIDNIVDNKSKTLSRFNALQFMGEPAAIGIQKKLRQVISQQATTLSTLNIGLSWLKQCDYREALVGRQVKQHWMFGQFDQLVPVAVGKALEDEFPDIIVSYFHGCAHAPHMTQPVRFAEKLLDFISQHTSK